MRDRTNSHHNVGGAHSHAQRIGHFAAVDGRAEMLAAAHVAESFGSFFVVHAYYDNAVSRAIDFGAKSVEHGHLTTEPVIERMADEGVYLVVEALMSMSEGSPDFTPEQQQKFVLAKAGFMQHEPGGPTPCPGQCRRPGR